MTLKLWLHPERTAIRPTSPLAYLIAVASIALATGLRHVLVDGDPGPFTPWSAIADTANAVERYQEKTGVVGREQFASFERMVLLQSIDTHWREHLASLDYLRQGIHLRGYAQKNPKQEYKREAFELFENLLSVVRTEVTKLLMTVQIRSEAQLEEVEAPPELENVQYHHAGYDEALATANPDRDAAEPEHRAGPKVGRNDPCPCGSGKKYKHCHGKLS